MKVILPVNKVVTTMLGDQKLIAGAYRPSQFNLVLREKETLIFNTFTKMLCILDEEECALLHGEVSIDSAEAVSPALRMLIEKRFMVPNSCDESEIYCQLYNLIYMMRKPKELSTFTIFTTTACNARCFYCFEADYKPVHMDLKTAEDVADYIIKHCTKDKQIRLFWFGGEPLCNVKVMDLISNKLRDNGIDFGSSITTNGLLFDSESVRKAKEDWKTTTIQITLDGMNDEHNRRKNYAAYSGDPFEVTIKNIHALLDADIAVVVRLNFDKQNLESIEQLIPFLRKEFEGERKFAAYPAVLFEDCSAWNPDRPPEEQQELLHHLFRLRDEMDGIKLYFPSKLSHDLTFERCGANNRSHRDILPNGKFTVCNNVGESDTYGSIYEGITDMEKYERWTNNSRLLDKCKDCAWLPECTSFDQCPIRRSSCRQEEEDLMRRKVLREYKKYLKKLECEESEA